MAQLIAVGSTATTFAAGEFIVPAGTDVVLSIKGSTDGGIPRDVEFEVAIKSSGGQYTTLLTLDADNIIEKGRVAGGSTSITYAARRLASANSAGMDWA
jgi:hypothetical protein